MPANPVREQRIRLVTFSGIDGAGKSTQIHALESWLAAAGLRVKTLRFWDDIVAGSRFRETASRLAFRGDQGIGSPDNPLHRRDKNVISWPLTLARFFLYFADTVSLALAVRGLHRSQADVVIFDRYIYDELANLPLESRVAQIFVGFVLKIVPEPDVAYLLEVAPETARARKPEYPIDFIHRNRHSYLALARYVANMSIVTGNSIDEMQTAIRAKLLLKMRLAIGPTNANSPLEAMRS